MLAPPFGACEVQETIVYLVNTEVKAREPLSLSAIGLVPVGYRFNDDGTIDIGGPDMGASQKYRNVQRDRRASFVVDDTVPDTETEFRPGVGRGIEIRGRAEALADQEPPGLATAGFFSRETIRIHPEHALSWHIDPERPAFGYCASAAGACETVASRPEHGAREGIHPVLAETGSGQVPPRPFGSKIWTERILARAARSGSSLAGAGGDGSACAAAKPSGSPDATAHLAFRRVASGAGLLVRPGGSRLAAQATEFM